ncbi:DUF3037 domain-containing protein [Chondrinema litorale]|uniref:DUF3037 domain-containing protein n=1 Tax=Chondrinema litorale TaxID=2994555 RepID=UPI0025436DE5|nr:DUF3037 domain-containing protein [Chondrinema litorale]UZR97606.1 DUF3037 domain-containing protein [Chondrinema litorale]
MQDRVTYEYAVIRLVPKVEREEFINVGVMLFSKPKRYIGIKYNIDESKIKAFSQDVDIDTIANYLKAWEDVCAGAPKGGSIGEYDMASRFRWLTASRSTIIQSSKTHPGMCTNPQEVLEDLYEYYVL